MKNWKIRLFRLETGVRESNIRGRSMWHATNLKKIKLLLFNLGVCIHFFEQNSQISRHFCWNFHNPRHFSKFQIWRHFLLEFQKLAPFCLKLKIGAILFKFSKLKNNKRIKLFEQPTRVWKKNSQINFDAIRSTCPIYWI